MLKRSQSQNWKTHLIVLLLSLFIGAISVMVDIYLDFIVLGHTSFSEYLKFEVTSGQLILRRFWFFLFPISALIVYRIYVFQQKKIKKRETLLDDILTHTTDVIILYSEDGIIQVNNSFYDMLDYDHNDIDELELTTFFPDLGQCENTGGGRFTWFSKFDEQIDVQVLLTENSYNDTKLMIVRNISDTIRLKSTLEQTKNQLLRSQKMELAGRFMNSVIHDFNNLLQIISIHFQLIEEDPSALEKHISPIKTSISKSESLIEQLLIFSKSSKDLKQEIIDINHEIEETRKLIQSVISSNIELSIDIYDVPLKTRINRSQLDQVLVNLIVNAKEAMPQGGRLEIRTTEVKKNDRNYILITVEDTGIGMDQDTLDQLSDPFYTTKGYGTGLGLFTVYTVVSQYKGEIQVRSTVGEGTTFEIYLPKIND